MVKSYQSPTVSDYGDIAAVTGIFGNPQPGDVLVDLNGDVVQDGDNSINACPTANFEACL